jgi:hypothetical protein
MPLPVRLSLRAPALPAIAVAFVLGLTGLAGAPRPADAAGRSDRHVRFRADWEKQPSARYAAMSGPACTAELARRGVAFTRVDPASAPGVVTPLRLPGDVDGVTYHTEAPAHLRRTSPYDIFDCRLVLALSDFSKVLRAHDVDEVRLFSASRPPPRPAPRSQGKLRPDHEAHQETRHGGALAIDARRFGKSVAAGHEGERVWLDVERDFHGAIGGIPCGPGAAQPVPATPEARELRSIACEAADQHLFTTILTPSYNRAHRNHFHLEVTPEVRWSLVR